MDWNLEHTYTRLPGQFFCRIDPVPVASPQMVLLNRGVAEELGLDPDRLRQPEGAWVLSGNQREPSSQPIAQAYAGHQFGHFAMLGDGRAHLLGEYRTPDGRRVDIQLKGSGPTPFSRRGDGRAALGPMLREYLIGEAMHGLGIPTTRALAVVATGERVFREQALPGAVLSRVAASHIRVGTFAYAAALDSGLDLAVHAPHGADDPSPEAAAQDGAGLTRALADYTIDRHYPELAEGPDRYMELFNAVMERQVDLVAQWMRVGFIHGVMNTDNMTLSGETIDYGPCAFMDQYDPATVFSSIDRQGRYAFGNQAKIAQWNLARLLETLLPLLHDEPETALARAQEAIGRFPALFTERWHAVMRTKLGLGNTEPGDAALIADLLQWMQDQGADYTNTFRELAGEAGAATPGQLNPAFADPGLAAWHARWRERLGRQDGGIDAAVHRMRNANPAVIPRNHQVEQALDAAVREGDLDPTLRLLEVLANPYDTGLDTSDYRHPPGPEQRGYQTFCGT
ncbi:MAG: YdiU family protein [Thioalkalivibrio sp.]|nr:MAG: YdiU family protein [Thioalkalivibrio sp.]